MELCVCDRVCYVCVCVRVCIVHANARVGLRLDLCAAYVCVWLHTDTAHV